MNSIFSRFFGSRSPRPKKAYQNQRPTLNFRPMVEGLEAREVLSHTPMGPVALGPAMVSQLQAESNLLENLDINITDIEFNEATNQILATFDLSGTLAGQDFTLNDLQLPINASILENEGGECSILHLELEIPDLNILGLHVQLDDCNNGPVVIDIFGVEGAGLLGDLLCGLAGEGGTLGDLLEGLTPAQLDDLTENLTDVLNGILDNILGSGGDLSPTQHNDGPGQGRGRRCDLVNLEIPEGLNLNVLGLMVETSPICLDVFAQRGDGLLGNLLCSVNNLLNNPGNPLNAINNLVDRVLDRLDRLGDQIGGLV